MPPCRHMGHGGSANHDAAARAPEAQDIGCAKAETARKHQEQTETAKQEAEAAKQQPEVAAKRTEDDAV